MKLDEAKNQIINAYNLLKYASNQNLTFRFYPILEFDRCLKRLDLRSKIKFKLWFNGFINKKENKCPI